MLHWAFRSNVLKLRLKFKFEMGKLFWFDRFVVENDLFTRSITFHASCIPTLQRGRKLFFFHVYTYGWTHMMKEFYMTQERHKLWLCPFLQSTIFIGISSSTECYTIFWSAPSIAVQTPETLSSWYVKPFLTPQVLYDTSRSTRSCPFSCASSTELIIKIKIKSYLNRFNCCLNITLPHPHTVHMQWRLQRKKTSLLLTW